MRKDGRLLHDDWNRYDTRHCVFQPQKLTPEQLEAGYWRAYKKFYRWKSIFRGACNKKSMRAGLRHAAYAAGWKKFEALWNFIIKTKRVAWTLPVLESVLSGFGSLGHLKPETRQNPAFKTTKGVRQVCG